MATFVAATAGGPAATAGTTADTAAAAATGTVEVGAVIDPAALRESDKVVEYGEGNDVELGLRWDFFDGMPKVDLDAQAVVFDGTGTVIDACFYNNMTALNGALTHSGDNRDGEGEGDDEAIRMDIDKFPAAARVVCIVVSAYSGGSFEHVESAYAQVRDCSPGGESVPKVDVSVGAHGKFTSMIMAVLFYHEPASCWYLREVKQPAMGRHFQECMDVIRSVVDTFIDPGMVYERVLSMETTFEMAKNDAAVLPPSVSNIFLGLGWETPDNNLDLDASCIMLDGEFPPNVKHTIYYGNKDGPGVHHMGDNTSGEGDGDDEQIKVDLSAVEEDVQQLVFTVNIYSRDRSFAEVRDSYIRLVADTTPPHELARYKLDAGLSSRALIFCKLRRTPRGWEVIAIGQGCEGQRSTDAATADVVRGILAPTLAVDTGDAAATAVAAAAEVAEAVSASTTT